MLMELDLVVENILRHLYTRNGRQVNALLNAVEVFSWHSGA